MVIENLTKSLKPAEKTKLGVDKESPGYFELTNYYPLDDIMVGCVKDILVKDLAVLLKIERFSEHWFDIELTKLKKDNQKNNKLNQYL